MRRLAGILVAAALLAAATLLGSSGLAPARASTSFTTSVLPADPTLGIANNQDAEPAVAVTPDGTLWAAGLYGVSGEGHDIWRSTDDGASWEWVAAPFRVTPSDQTTLAGDDVDIAVAPEANSGGHYNIYTASLWAKADAGGLIIGDVSLAISQDSGATWLVHPLAAELPVDDRPWLAADGPCRVYLNYHAGPTLANVVNVYDLCDPVATVAGSTLAPIASTRYPDLLVPAVTGQRATYVTAGFGKAVVDTSAASAYRHNLYIPMMDCPDVSLDQEVARAQAGDATCPSGTNAAVFVAIGTQGATSWTFHRIATSASRAVPIWPATAAVDPSGRVYVAWHDNQHAYLQSSSDGGTTWSTPVLLNAGGTAVYPTVSAGAGGTVDVAWYGSDAVGDANDQAVMGLPNSSGAAVWSLRWVRSHDAGATFDPLVIADPIVHTGVLCTNGEACTIPNSRDLLDDFGVVTSPITGHTTVVYTSDQPSGTRAGRAVHAAAEVG